MDDTIKFRLAGCHLSDGSSTWDAVICQQGASIRLPAISEVDAINLQKKIWDAIKLHTNETVEFFEEGF